MKHTDHVHNTTTNSGSSIGNIAGIYNKQTSAIALVGEEPDKNTVFISVTSKLWRVHTGTKSIAKLLVLKSSAIAAAIKYVASFPEGAYTKIEIQGTLGEYYTWWALGVDTFPPQKKPNELRKANTKGNLKDQASHNIESNARHVCTPTRFTFQNS